MRMAFYKPDYLTWEASSKIYQFHGYMTCFLNKYVDVIYAYSADKRKTYEQALNRRGLSNHYTYVYSLDALNEQCDVLIMPGITYKLPYAEEIGHFKGVKIQHLFDYYLDCKYAAEYYTKIGIDYVIGHCQMDRHCPLFNKYYSSFVGRVINLPMGYSDRFRCKTSFDNRENKAIAVGSLLPIKSITDFGVVEMVEMFPDAKYMTPVREFVRFHEAELNDCIDTRFPTSSTGRDYSFDMVDLLNQYKMFINDEAIFNMPLCKTFEGIACGSVMVAQHNEIFHDLGFIPDKNYISFTKNDYSEMVDKVRYYQSNPHILSQLQEKSLQLAERYTHEKIADVLYKKITDVVYGKYDYTCTCIKPSK